MQGEPREKKIEQVLSNIQVLYFDVKKFLHKLLLTKTKTRAQPKVRKNSMLQKFAQPLDPRPSPPSKKLWSVP